MNQTGYRKRVTLLLFSLLLLRFWYGQTFELTGAEAMVWLRGKHLALGYWGQGPILPCLASLGVHFFGVTELGLRWVAAAITAASGFLLFYVARQIFGARAGFCTLVLYLLLPLYVWQPLLLSEATVNIGLMAAALLTFRQAAERDRLADWVLAGLVAALAVLLSGWNLLWALGLLLFRAMDEHRHERWWRPRVGLFLGLALLGFVPFFAWHARIGLPHDLGASAWYWLSSKQYRNDLDPHPALGFGGLWSFVREQGVWLSPVGAAALAYAVWRAREEVFLRRSHLFLLSLAVPGMIVQTILSFRNLQNQDALSALYLPILVLGGGVASRRLWGAHHFFWRRIASVIVVLAAAQSFSGLLPKVAERVWPRYSAVRPIHERHWVAEVERMQREIGAGVIVTDTPRTAALLQFYLPFHPFVHVVTERVTQFDFWEASGFKEGEGEAPNALLLLRAAEVPDSVRRDFAVIRPLPAIPIPEADGWRFFLCERIAAPQAQP